MAFKSRQAVWSCTIATNQDGTAFSKPYFLPCSPIAFRKSCTTWLFSQNKHSQDSIAWGSKYLIPLYKTRQKSSFICVISPQSYRALLKKILILILGLESIFVTSCEMHQLFCLFTFFVILRLSALTRRLQQLELNLKVLILRNQKDIYCKMG